MSFTPSPAQQAFYDFVENGRGSCILEAVAGAGKTTTLVTALDKMRGRVFLGAYNKTMSDELKLKVGRRSNVFISTFHSAGFSALRYRFSKDIEVDADKCRTIARAIADKNNRDDLKELVNAVCKFVSMAKNVGIGVLRDAPTWEQMVRFYDLESSLPDDEEDSRKAIEFAKRVLAISNQEVKVVDYDDMTYLSLLKNCRFFSHDYVLIDEAQDTNPVRLEMATRMLSPNGRLFAVGDRYQAIYGFSGALSNALDLIEERFQATVLPLTTTYRCPKAVVQKAQEVVPHIVAHDSAPEGTYSEIDDVDIIETILKLPFDETGILCRYNKPLVSMAFQLLREEIPCYIEGRPMGLALTRRWKINSNVQLKARVQKHMKKEVEKARAEDNEARVERIMDECETLTICIDRALEKGLTQVNELRQMIEDLFDTKDGFCLSSVHRSKGLEWDNVLILYRYELMPPMRYMQPWQEQQEQNLIYVATTRAKKNLIIVNEKPEE